ncbi:MAG: glycogen synthase GlgA [Alphaproteobacteria bacterium]|nr:glycogen synthase GlgA [Alphaproteobacteria bacterium]
MTGKKNKKTQVAGRVLSVASEFAPLVKTGGLADVVGALPGALAVEGWSVRTLLPAYPGLVDKLASPTSVWSSDDLFGGKARVVSGRLGKTKGSADLLLLDAPHLFAREGTIYLGEDGRDWPDNPQRFAALSRVAAEIANVGLPDGWRPEILHAHDWQAGLAPTYLKQRNILGVATVMTIHNIAFQGLAPATMLDELLLSKDRFDADGYEYWGQISTLKAGLVDADWITTVSPTYVNELATLEFGMGLDGVIRQRQATFSGILNGVDLAVWNPRKDTLIPRPFGPRKIEDKRQNTDALAQEFGLGTTEGPLFGVVSRLTRQKGLDLLLEVLPDLVERGGRLVVLGSGDADLEAGFAEAARKHSDRVAVHIGYDEALSHRIYAGADCILVPSRFEPCGLTQMYALRYGALPLVARTGGLADTVIDANDAAVRVGVATGVQFSPATADALSTALDRVFGLFGDPVLWRQMQERAMKHPVGWSESAKAYAALYQSLME